MVWDGQLIRGTGAQLEVRLRGARTLTESEPVAGHAQLQLVQRGRADDAETWPLFDGPIRNSSWTTLAFDVPRVPPGTYLLRLQTRSKYGGETVERPVTVLDRTRLQLRCDRGVYKPGQTIRWRAIVLNGADAHAIGGEAVNVSIRDPRGTEVWRDRLRTSRRGMASGELALAEQLVTGKYTIQVSAAGASARQTVEVRPFVLPPYEVGVTLDEGALARGEEIEARVVARHHYGEPVKGQAEVLVSSSTGATQRHRGALDEEGRFAVPLQRSGDRLSIEVAVVDGADRRQSATRDFSWKAPALQILVIPESEVAIAGRDHVFTIVTADQDGQPVASELVIDVADGKKLTRSSPGALRLEVPLPVTRESPYTERTTQLREVELASSTDEPLLREAGERLEAWRDRLGACLQRRGERDGASLQARLQRRRWHLVRAGRHPFEARPEFLVPVSDGERSCLERTLNRSLNASLRKVPRKTTGTLSLSLSTRDVARTRQQDVRRAAVRVKATTPDGLEMTAVSRVKVARRDRARSLPVTVDRFVVSGGETVSVSAPWVAGAVTATLMSHNTAVASAPCTLGQSRASCALTVPQGVMGLLDVRVSAARWNPAERDDVRLSWGSTAIYARPMRLDVDVDVPPRLRPGEETALDIKVRDGRGEAVPGAGIAASVVDERVLALSDPIANLSEILNPTSIEGAARSGRVFAGLLGTVSPSPVQRLVMRAILERLGARAPRPSVVMSATQRYRDERRVFDALRRPALDRLARKAGRVVSTDGGALVASLDELLEEAGWSVKRRQDPWGRARTWSYLTQVMQDWTVHFWALGVTETRLDRLARLLSRDKGARARRVYRRRGEKEAAALVGRASYLASDAWGNPLVIRGGDKTQGMSILSAGPDGVLDTSDDLVRDDVLDELVHHYGYGALGSAGVGAGGGGGARGIAGRVSRAVGGGSADAPMTVAIRKRFDETVLWSIGEETGPDGSLRLPLRLADSVTGFQVDVEAVGPDGGLGVARTRVETFLPSYVDVQLPPRLTAGDRFTATAVVMHHGQRPGRFEVQASTTGPIALEDPGPWTVDVDGARAVRLRLRASDPGEGTLRLVLNDAASGQAIDGMDKVLPVIARGMVEHRIVASVIEDGKGHLSVDIPDDAEPATVDGQLRVYRGAADQALDGLEGMLREPHGCFEQTSSTTFPNLLVLQLLQGRPGHERSVQRARELVGKGYQRLLTYEVAGGGFSWFGDAPANNVLTAYGLLEFVEMARVYPVDDALIARTRRWLVRQQRKDGSWAPAHRWSDSQSRGAVTAYLAWALAESGGSERAVKRALAYLRRDSKVRDDAYALALWAVAERRLGRSAAMPLAALQRFERDGPAGRFIEAQGRNLFFEGGSAANIEATAILAGGLDAGPEAAQGNQSRLDWLWSQRDERYGWGTTQATVQALRAAALGQRTASAPASGTLDVQLDGTSVATLDLATPQLPSARIVRPGPGSHRIAIDATDEMRGRLRADLRLSWRRRGAPVAGSQGLVVHSELPSGRLAPGETGPLTIGLMNPGREVIAMPTIAIPVPPGLSPDDSSLRRLVRETAVTRFDDRGDAVFLYLERLEPGDALLLQLALRADSECDVMQHPVQAWAYYDPDVRGWGDAGRWRVGDSKQVAHQP